MLSPPGTGKTHLATGPVLRATQLGHRVLFETAIDWVARLQAAHQALHRRCGLDSEVKRPQGGS
ncbi:ATP-binding protein [Arthrobacter sp. efr-133-TYG-118]|uniref:ATP-binding protein n=1 Tax=Arthrobacter sp. efr-133-TYG-118 TaxID=3040279 RepID=UPI00254E48AD|nr:ATP-binding protein [Arthrobacter sp. efr-133-TYG-118]